MNLIRLAQRGSVEEMSNYISQDKSNINVKVHPDGTPLTIAAKVKKTAMAIFLLEAGADILKTDVHDKNAFHYAIINQDDSLLEYIKNSVFPKLTPYQRYVLLTARGGGYIGLTALEYSFLKKNKSLFDYLFPIYEKEIPEIISNFRERDLKIWIDVEISEDERWDRLMRRLAKGDPFYTQNT